MSHRIVFIKRPNPVHVSYIEVWMIHGTEPSHRMPFTIYPTQTKKWTLWGAPKWQELTPQKIGQGATTRHTDYSEFIYEAPLEKVFQEVKKIVRAYIGNYGRN